MNEDFKDIIFFSLHYPYEFSDSYLDEEINLLSKNYRKVIVITSNISGTYKRPTPSNSVVYRFSANSQKIPFHVPLSLLVMPFFYRELFLIVRKYRIPFSVQLLKELVAFYSRTVLVKNYVEKIVLDERLNHKNLLLYNYWMLESAFASVLLKKKFPLLKVISKAHSQDVYFFRSPVNYHPFRKYIFDRLEHLYFISESVLNYFVDKHQLAIKERTKISVSRIGIKGQKSVIEKESDEKLKIISVAYVQKLKRIELIIDALSLIKDITIEWYHVGHGVSTAYFNEVISYANQKLSMMPNITFVFTGDTSKQELFQLYAEKQFDIFLNVSETEGIPVSMMEAMSYSVPVTGTNVGGVKEIIENEKNGFLINAEPTPVEIANKLRQYYLMNDQQKNEFRFHAHKTWKEKYNAEKNYLEFVKNVASL